MPVDVRRHAEKDHSPALSQIVGKLCKLGRLNKRNPMLGQKIIQHARVLHADERAEHTEHPGGQPKIKTDTISVPGPGAGAGADNHLMVAAVFYDSFD